MSQSNMDSADVFSGSYGFLRCIFRGHSCEECFSFHPTLLEGVALVKVEQREKHRGHVASGDILN